MTVGETKSGGGAGSDLGGVGGSMKSELPSGWESAQLACLAQLINGDRGDSYPNKSSFVSEGVPFINAGHLNDGEITSTEMNYISPGAFDALRSGHVQEDDILFCLRGSLGKVGLVKSIDKGAIASSLVIVRPTDPVSPAFLLYFLRSQLAKKEIEKHNNGSAQPNLASKSLARFVLPVAPIKEQKRIADKLDTVLTRVDAVNTRLARVAPLLKRFRQSVLAAAASGRLTEDWRETSQSATRIGQELQSLNEFRGSELEALPIDWFWTTFDKVAVVASDLRDPRDFQTARHLAPNHIEAHTGKISGCLTIADDKVTSPKHLFKAGQLVYSKIRPNLCKVAIPEFEGLCSADMYPIDTELHTRYLWLWMLTDRFTEWAANAESRTVLPKINKNQLGKIPTPVAPREEQTEIVRRVETLFAFADRLEARLAQAQTAATRLTPALLAKAFRGELVPQDPNDEPAAELLRRLAQAPAAASPRKSRKAASAASAAV